MTGTAGVVWGIKAGFGAQGGLSVFHEGIPAFGEVLDKAVSPRAHIGGGIGVASEIVQFMRILFEIKKLFMPVACVKDAFLPAVGECVPVNVRVVADIVLEINERPPIRLGITGEREKISACD